MKGDMPKSRQLPPPFEGRSHSIAMHRRAGIGLMVDGSARKGDEDRDNGQSTRDTTNEDRPPHNIK